MAKTKTHEPRLTGAQIRAARGLLNITAADLAADTKLSLKTIRRAEQADGRVDIHAANAERIISVLEEKGVRLLGLEDGGFGVQLRPDSLPRTRGTNAG